MNLLPKILSYKNETGVHINLAIVQFLGPAYHQISIPHYTARIKLYYNRYDFLDVPRLNYTTYDDDGATFGYFPYE
jgi:hypothetical protein